MKMTIVTPSPRFLIVVLTALFLAAFEPIKAADAAISVPLVKRQQQSLEVYSVGLQHALRRAGRFASTGSPSPSPFSSAPHPLPFTNDASNLLFCIGEIGIGSPPQHFSMLFDTGSDVMWVPSRRCVTAACLNHNRFRRANSSTYRKIPGRFIPLKYGTGTTFVSYAEDSVTVGNETVVGVKFGEVVYQPSRYHLKTRYDGILGLSFPLREYPYGTIWTYLFAQGALPDPLFSVFFNLNNFQTNSGGEIVFGGVNSNHYTGTHVYAPLTSTTYWQFNVASIAVNSVTGICPAQGCDVIADTGTNVILGPFAAVSKICKAVGVTCLPNQFAKVGCSNFATLPTVTFTIGGVQLPLTPEQYVIQALDGCYLGFAGSLASLPFWILGDPFLAAYHTIYDFGNKRIGFAPSKP